MTLSRLGLLADKKCPDMGLSWDVHDARNSRFLLVLPIGHLHPGRNAGVQDGMNEDG
jgi:hypothetical protein